MRILRTWQIDIGVKTGRFVFWLAIAFVYECLCSTQLRAQDNNNYCVNPLGAVAGGFTLDKYQICAGGSVTIISGVPSGLGAIGYYSQYDGKGIPTAVPTPPSPTPVFTYTKPGSYTILQVGSLNGKGAISCKEVIVKPLDPVKFTAKACSGRKVVVDVTLDASTSQYDNFVIYWGDGQNSGIISRANITTQQAHTYTNTTSYTIYITGSYGSPATCGTSIPVAQTTQQTVTTLSTAAAPSINQLSTTGDNTITLQYQSSSSVQLLQKDASGIYAQTGQVGTGSGTFTVQTDAKQVQCFQLVNQDACDNTAGLKSDQVCSLVLDVKAASQQNDVSWQPYAGSGPLRSYRLTRNNTSVYFNTNRTNSTYTDKPVECGVQYCYSLQAIIQGTAQTIVNSATSCVTGINNEVPGNFGTTSVSIENNHPKLITTLPTTGTSTSYTITISRASNSSGTYEEIGTTTKNTFTDASVDASAGSYCYRLTYRNACGQTSPASNPVCTVFLSSQSTTGIDWTAASPFLSGSVSSYVLEIIDSVNNATGTEALGGMTHKDLDNTSVNQQTLTYRIIAVSDKGDISYSNFFTFRREPKILVPDAFTPNGDTNNDVFLARGIYVDKFSMTIYSRWGEVVYNTTDKTKGWDGMMNGQPAIEGQYMYRIEVEDLTGQKTVRTGGLLLLR